MDGHRKLHASNARNRGPIHALRAGFAPLNDPLVTG
jgi:hypothetical protein